MILKPKKLIFEKFSLNGKKLSSDVKILHIYFAAMLGFILAGIVNIFVSNGNAIYDMLIPNMNNHYWDLITSIFHNYAGMPYEEGVIYPPGANIICLLLSKMFSLESYMDGINAMRDSQIGMLVIMWFLLSTVTLFISLICYQFQGTRAEKLCLVLTILLSAPYVREISKANLVMVSVICVYVFILFKDHESVFMRVLAFVALSAAVALKIYPVFLGILLLREKSAKKIWGCIGCGIVVFFVPFFVFGGLHGVVLMLQNIFNTTSIFNDSGLGFKIDITNTINIVGDLFHYGGNIRRVGTCFNYIFLILGFVMSLFVQEEWKAVTLLSLLTLSYPTFSGSYGILIMVPALIMFLNTKPGITHENMAYILLFVLLFAPMFFGGQNILPALDGEVRINLFTLTESVAIILMEMMLIFDGLIRMICLVGKKIKMK